MLMGYGVFTAILDAGCWDAGSNGLRYRSRVIAGSCRRRRRTSTIAPTPRPRADVSAWADERTRLAIDPEWGPGWHLGVLPLEDGGAAVSLVASHAIVDAIAFGQAIADAAEGRTHDLGYPPAGSRTRRRALREDLGQTVKELPDIAQALVAVARRARRDREELKSSIKAAPPSPSGQRRSA